MIKMISGVFGLPQADGSVKPMDKNSKPFSTSKELEKKLVEKKRAVYVDTVEDVDTSAPIGFDETPPEEFEELPELPEGVTAIPEYSEDMKQSELREIGAMCGLTFKVGMTKKEMVAALDAHIEANTVEGDELEEEDDSPEFDASEAVQ